MNCLKTCTKCNIEKSTSEFYIKHSWCKECSREYSRAYRNENIDVVSKKEKEYRDNNREKKKEYFKFRYIRNRSEILKQNKERYIKNKVRINKQNKEWYHNNKERALKWHREYRKKYPHVDQLASQRRRSRKKSLQNTLTSDQWLKIIEAQNRCCAMCGKNFNSKRKPTIDHIIPISRGGGTTYENTQALCVSCNSSKNNKLLPSLIQTWLIDTQHINTL